MVLRQESFPAARDTRRDQEDNKALMASSRPFAIAAAPARDCKDVPRGCTFIEKLNGSVLPLGLFFAVRDGSVRVKNSIMGIAFSKH